MEFLDGKSVYSSNTGPGWRHRTRERNWNMWESRVMVRTASENETEETSKDEGPARKKGQKDRVLLCGWPMKVFGPPEAFKELGLHDASSWACLFLMCLLILEPIHHVVRSLCHMEKPHGGVPVVNLSSTPSQPLKVSSWPFSATGPLVDLSLVGYLSAPT